MEEISGLEQTSSGRERSSAGRGFNMKPIKKTLAMLVGISFLEGCVEQQTYRSNNHYAPVPTVTPTRDEKPAHDFRGKYNGFNLIPKRAKLVCDIYPVETL